MKRKVFKYTIIFIIILVFTIILTKNNDSNTKNLIEEKSLQDEKNKTEELLEEDISILIPTIEDNCDIDDCITTNTINNIYNYLKDNNYEEIKKDPFIYFKSASNLIKITITNKDTTKLETTSNNTNYDYIFNRYTTIDDLKKILNNQKISIFTGDKATEIAVLNYHFFYDAKTEDCNQSICLDITTFEEQLKYLKENNFKTLTISEYASWIYKEIDLPQKSVLITIDDGAMGTSKINGNKLIPLLEKYEINATLFLITGWWPKENYKSDYLDIQSHTNLMHDENICSNKTRGAEMLCSTKEEIITDLKKSLTKVDDNTAFCFPFYLYDDKSIEALQELEFKVAFIGGNKKSNQNNDKFKIPRYIIYKTTSLNSFKSMVN